MPPEFFYLKGEIVTVKVADREESSCQYMECAKNLAVRVGEIVVNGPRKYLMSHGDHLIRIASELYMHCQIANSIYMGNGPNIMHDYNVRRTHLLEARGMVDHVCSEMKIYLDLTAKVDGTNGDSKKADENRRKKQREAKRKNSARKADIGNRCSELSNMLSGVIKSDWERVKSYNRHKDAARK